jgi:hypothetical protein
MHLSSHVFVLKPAPLVRKQAARIAKPFMSRRLQLILILGLAVALAAGTSHIIIGWLRIETTTGKPWEIKSENGTGAAFMAGSSLAADGIDWGRVSAQFDEGMLGWGVAGSSPWEWEAYQAKTDQVNLTFLVASIYDLNEQFLCDFHADVVPLARTVNDLRGSHAGWHFSKRVLSQYAVKYVRLLFPTVGRADGVMTGLRDHLRDLLKSRIAIEAESGPTMATGKAAETKEYKKGTIRDWDAARMLRRLASMRAACQGSQVFDGPKNLAFNRMLLSAQQQGRVVVLILPVSPAYKREFVTPEVTGRFERALSEAQRQAPQASWVRLDNLAELNSNDYFWDLVHMNLSGQGIATKAFLTQANPLESSN